MNCKYLRKKTKIEKKANSALQHLRVDSWIMIGEERLNALLLVCIHRDIFLNYHKVIKNYASKYQRRILLINPK